jgi:hypothetical protein
MVVGIIMIVIVGTSIWVYADAKNLGVHQGALGGGFVDAGAGQWAAVTLLLWIVGFPLYLATRPRYVERRARQKG